MVPCGQADGRSDTIKLTVAFQNFANAPKLRKSAIDILMYRGTIFSIFFTQCLSNFSNVSINKQLICFQNSFGNLHRLSKGKD